MGRKERKGKGKEKREEGKRKEKREEERENKITFWANIPGKHRCKNR